jgi:alpha-1,2-mannosyltransferase
MTEVTPSRPRPTTGRWWTSTTTLVVMALGLWLLVGLYMLHWGRSWNLDLEVYRRAGLLLRHGGQPYRATFTIHRLAFTYPPFALFALNPLSWGPLPVVRTLWWLLNAGCLVTLLALALRQTTRLRRTRLVAVAGGFGALSAVVFEPLRNNMDYGQINWILMLLVVLDLTTITGKWRGTLIGVAAAVKLTPMIYLGYFVVQRQWRALTRGVSVFVGLTLIACLVLQVGTLGFWHDLFFKRSHAGATDGTSNQSWLGLLFRSPLHGGPAAVVLWVPLVLVTVAAGLLLTRRLLTTDRVVDAVVALALTELLVSPISWTHHWSWVVLVPLLAADAWRRYRVVGALMALLIAVSIAGPYWWLRPTWIFDDSLVAVGAALLFVWTAAELRSPARDTVTPGVVDAGVASTVDGPTR